MRCAALREAELGAALVRDEAGVVRVLLDPGADVGAVRQHREVALARVVEGEPGQVRGQVRALEGGLYLRVLQADRLAVAVVGDEAGEFPLNVVRIDCPRCERAGAIALTAWWRGSGRLCLTSLGAGVMRAQNRLLPPMRRAVHGFGGAVLVGWLN